jgi:hypothetical protein
LCSFANCTVLPNTTPPIAECGCAGFSTPSRFNTTNGNTQNVLDAALAASTVATCASQDPSVNCASNASNPTPFARAMLYADLGGGGPVQLQQRVVRMYSPLPPSLGGQGALALRVWRDANVAYKGGKSNKHHHPRLRLGWDLISAYNPGTWPAWTNPTTQGSSANGARTCSARVQRHARHLLLPVVPDDRVVHLASGPRLRVWGAARPERQPPVFGERVRVRVCVVVEGDRRLAV